MRISIFQFTMLIFLLLSCDKVSNAEKYFQNKEAVIRFTLDNDKYYLQVKDVTQLNIPKIQISVDVENVNDFSEEQVPYSNTKSDEIKLMNKLNAGQKIDGSDLSIGVAKDCETIKLKNGFYCGLYTILYWNAIDDILFDRTLFFYNGNNKISITISGAKNLIIAEQKDSFKKEGVVTMWKSLNSVDLNNFINNVKKSNKDSNSAKWYNAINNIIETITINYTDKIYYKPSIDNLLFRKKPGTNGDLIKKLTNTDVLELIETGEGTVINGKTGNWVQVKTQKGELGWCFDAYLDFYKKE